MCHGGYISIVAISSFSTLHPEVAQTLSRLPMSFCSLVGVVEDRSVLMGFLGVIIEQPIA